MRLLPVLLLNRALPYLKESKEDRSTPDDLHV